MYDQDEFRPRRLYRNTRNRRIAGVFSGIADYMNFSVGATRLFGFIVILMTMPLGLFAYAAAALMLQPMPENAYNDPVEERFVRSLRASPEETFSKVSYRFKNIDSRLQRMERYVTSKRFDLDQEFDRLQESDKPRG